MVKKLSVVLLALGLAFTGVSSAEAKTHKPAGKGCVAKVHVSKKATVKAKKTQKISKCQAKKLAKHANK